MRVKDLQLDKFDFNGKVILDVGGNLGIMGRELNDRGVTRVVNLDVAGLPNAAAHLDYYLGYFNNDHIHDCNLTSSSRTIVLQRMTGIKKYDFILYLAVCEHIEFQEDFSKIGDKVIFEGHHFTTDADVMKWLKPFYSKVEKIGQTTDGNHRLIYLAE